MKRPIKETDEPHPDAFRHLLLRNLKRCEICKHNSSIAGVNTMHPYCIKLNEAGVEITFPSAKTCANWEWDQHDTGGK